MNQQRTRPIQKFAKAVSQCSVEATAYGKCIVADYNAVHKDKCAKEFMRLKDCYLVCPPIYSPFNGDKSDTVTQGCIQENMMHSCSHKQHTFNRTFFF
ncbi:hypothetical protein FOFC_14818 [Fusarium oxysporum]|nr:hypothetical protein FOFC_14818 [Fusarium oxysporum]